MKSLPPHANEPDISQFLDDDEAASLSEALLHLVEGGSGKGEPVEGKSQKSSESCDRPVSIRACQGRISRTSEEGVAQKDPTSGSVVDDVVEIDLVRRSFSARQSQDDVAPKGETEDRKESGRNEESAPNDETARNGSAGERDVGEGRSVFFFARPDSDSALMDNVTGVDRDGCVKSFAVADGEADINDLATVAGSGFSEGSPSETIAGSGGWRVIPPSLSSGSMSARRTGSQSRLGFDSEELDEISNMPCAGQVDANSGRKSGADLRSSRPVDATVSPTFGLVSSDLAGIQTFRTAGVKLAELRHGSSSIRGALGSTLQVKQGELDGILSGVMVTLASYKKDRAVAAMAVVVVLSICVLGWLTFSRLGDWSVLSANVRYSLLFIPLALRLSTFAESASLALLPTDQSRSGRVGKERKPGRYVTTAKFEVHEVAVDCVSSTCTNNRRLVDLPRLDVTVVPRRTAGGQSVVNPNQPSGRAQHRKRLIDRVASVINRR